MKISVLIPSRARALTLRNALDTMRSLESGENDISYTIGVDSDDDETLAICHLMKLMDCRVSHRCFVRRSSLGSMMNQLIEENPADAYCCLADDTVVLTPHWDNAIADAWEERSDGVWWWRTLAVRPATYAVISEKWRQAAGKVWTDYFPCWWDDMWLMQVWRMASDGPSLALNAALDDQARATHRMRNLREWADFYTHQKGKRQAQALRIAKALGWPKPSLEDTACDVSTAFLKEADKIEANQGDKGPPTPEYMQAYGRMRSMMGLQ